MAEAKKLSGTASYSNRKSRPNIHFDPIPPGSRPNTSTAPGDGILHADTASEDSCEVLASLVHDIIRSFHSSVASPLASIGLQLEVLRMDSDTSAQVASELARITAELDDVITTIRQANRSLRAVEKRILENDPTVADCVVESNPNR